MNRLRRALLRHLGPTAVAACLLTTGLALAPTTCTASAAAATFQAVNPGTIDPNATGTLTIHAVLGTPLDQTAYPADGRELTLPAGVTPLPGAVYTVTRVTGVDLTTAAGWSLAGTYFDNVEAVRSHLGSVLTSAPTNSAGVTTISGLPVGLYLVHEASGADHDGMTSVRDFLVTVPTANPVAGPEWLYTVHVYPKRERITLTKSVVSGSTASAAPGASSAGGELSYLLESSVPGGGVRAFGGRCERGGAVDAGPGLDRDGFTAQGWCATGATYLGTAAGAAYQVVDDFTANPVSGTSNTLADYITLVSDGWRGTVTVTLASSGAKDALTICTTGVVTGCDVVITQRADYLSAALTDQGLRKAAAARDGDPNTTVRVQFGARVSAAGAELMRQQLRDRPTITLPNTAQVFANDVAVSAAAPLSSNTVNLRYAALKLHKVDAKTSANLAGAVFEVYASKDDALARRDTVATSTASDATGLVLLAGLPAISDPSGQSGGTYWIVETKAPAGYTGLKVPVRVTLLPDGTTLNADASGGYPVANTRTLGTGTGGGSGTGSTVTRPGKLAFTGAELGPVLAAALFLIGLGVPLARRRRSRRPAVDR